MAVLKMLNEIRTVENIPEFIEGVKNRKRKMSGFGHRVYKNYDPRAKVTRKLAEEVFSIDLFSIVGRDLLIVGRRCLTNFEALRFSEPKRLLVENMVEQMVKSSSMNGGKYIFVHLRFEEHDVDAKVERPIEDTLMEGEQQQEIIRIN